MHQTFDCYNVTYIYVHMRLGLIEEINHDRPLVFLLLVPTEFHNYLSAYKTLLYLTQLASKP